MLMEENLLTKNNKRLIIFFILLLGFLLLILFDFKFPCLFKKILKISCPACGLTRAIFSLIKLDIKTSIHYNILGIPLLIILIITYLLVIIDITKKSNYLIKFWSNILKHYKLIFTLLIISFILNNF